MPRKKGGRSGTPDGYSPSPLGEEPRGRSRSPRVGDSPRDSPRGGRSPTREAVPAPRLAPVPSWRGLRACLPRGSEPRAGELEAEPVATGFGAHAHVLLSPRMMTNAGLGPGDWVALARFGATPPAAARARRMDAPPTTTPTRRPPPSARRFWPETSPSSSRMKTRARTRTRRDPRMNARVSGVTSCCARAPARQGVVAKRRRAGAEDVDVARAARRTRAHLGVPAGRREGDRRGDQRRPKKRRRRSGRTRRRF